MSKSVICLSLCSLGSRPAPGATGHKPGAKLIKPYAAHSPAQLLAFQRSNGHSGMRCNLQKIEKQVYGGNLREYGRNLRTEHLQHVGHLANTSA